MYTLTITNYTTSQTFEFNGIREALNSFIERCDDLGLDYSEDNCGNFTAGGYGYSHVIELTSNF